MKLLRTRLFPQKTVGLTSAFASQIFSFFNNLQSVVQQPRFTQFMPLSISSQGFLPFDPNIMLLNNGGMLHNVNFPRIPMQQNNFNYLSVAYPLSPMAFFQQPRGPTIDTASTSYTAYNNTSNNFIHPVNTLRSSLFNIDSILGNGQIRGNNQG